MTGCQQQLKAEGKPYPRTCGVCKLGPCQHGYAVRPEAKLTEHVKAVKTDILTRMMMAHRKDEKVRADMLLEMALTLENEYGK